MADARSKMRGAIRACLKTTRGAAAKDFGCGQGGEVGASPQRAVTTEPTRVTGKRPAARRVFSKRPSGFVAPQSKIHEGDSPSSRLAIRPFAGKQHSRVDFKQALTRILHSSTETERSPMFTGSFRRTEKIALDSVSKRNGAQKVQPCRMNIDVFTCWRANTMKYPG